MSILTRLGLRTIAISFFAAMSASAYAQLNVDITGVGASQYPIAVANFRDQNTAPQPISAIIRADLADSGRFSNVNVEAAPVAENDSIDLGNWKARGAAALVAGSVIQRPDGQYEVRFRLYDTGRQQSLGGLSLVSPRNDLRLTAHKIADYIYQKLLGIQGVFATRLAYVVRTGGRYQLQISDADGQNAHVALSSAEPIISPSWSPDGTKIAYVSFERKKPVIYVHDLSTGQRVTISNQKGNNSAPAWSPDSQRLAVSLTLTGNTQIYLVNADGSALRRLTQSASIDTEPQFSPDGGTIYFTSDRGGAPQIYRMSVEGEAAGSAARRVTFSGNYNTSPHISPDGKLLAYISRSNGAFKLYVQDLATGAATSLTDTRHDESPSFAANSQYILYATQVDGRGVLAAVSVDGSARRILSVQGGNVREPSWGPFTQ